MEHPNWLAFVVAVIAQMIIGYIWFHPSVIGKKWADANNKSIDELKPKNPGLVYGLTLLFTILYTMFIMVNVTGFGQENVQFHTVKHGLFHAILFLIMVIFPVLGSPAIHEGRNKNWYITQFSYWAI